ncbi:MAG: MFS transporter [Paludibacteraceae bacterium]|nr:MFS transporter [Paludibacteraceae bacterium]
MNQRDLSFRQLFNLSFGFFGVQIAYALQSANISRIFATLGADPHQLSFFWILPPLMGMIVQPIIGLLSDKTWLGPVFGRRKFYLLIGAVIAVAVMVLLPNAGDFTFRQSAFLGLNAAMWFGLFSLMFLDTSINIAMQPFKMMVGDTVNEKQKGTAYAIQSALCNAGSLVGYLFPIFFTWIGIANTAAAGVIPDSVKWSFYIGAAILIICVLYTFAAVKEMDPEEYAKFHNIKEATDEQSAEADRDSRSRIVNAFVAIGLVQFFCWAAFMYMWTYSNGAIASLCFGWDGVDTKVASFQDAGNWVGVVFAIQAVGSLLWAALLPAIEHKIGNKGAYIVSLVVGGIGFASIMFVHNQYVLFLSYALVGAAWAAMLALPFTLFTNAIQGSKRMGTLLGLFNCTICLPQIVAALCGGLLLKHICGGSQAAMLLIAGVLLILGALSVTLIKENDK